MEMSILHLYQAIAVKSLSVKRQVKIDLINRNRIDRTIHRLLYKAGMYQSSNV